MPPDPRAAATARDAILDAAEALFARHGFAATTIKEIGARARVNPALLYYYFSSKERLYRAMLRRRIDAFIGRGLEAIEHAASPDEAVRALLATQARFLLDHPTMAQLLTRELADHRARHAESTIVHLAATLFTRFCAVIRDGQQAGVFRRDLHPQFAAISAVSQIAHFAIARPAIDIFLASGSKGVTPATADAFARHAAEFALAALHAPAAARTARRRATPPPSAGAPTTRAARARPDHR
jgi:TetR/AcrR family transcriptional regulator